MLEVELLGPSGAIVNDSHACHKVNDLTTFGKHQIVPGLVPYHSGEVEPDDGDGPVPALCRAPGQGHLTLVAVDPFQAELGLWDRALRGHGLRVR